MQSRQVQRRLGFLFLSAALVLHASLGMAATNFKGMLEIPLWGDAEAPGTKGLKLEEKWVNNSFNPIDPERDLTGISTPSLSVFVPRIPNGSAMIVVPGGGYSKNVYDKEGVEIARWLTSIGVTAFVLKYRLPAEWPDGGRHMPLQDGQRAMRLLRSHAADWNIDPKRIGVIGFSAGGHLAAIMGTAWKKKTYEPVDADDAASAKPDAMVIVYGIADAGANTLGKPAPEKISERVMPYFEYPATELGDQDSSQAFIVAADDDTTVNAEQSARLYMALHKAKVPTELHLFRNGNHGFAIRKTQALPLAEWTLQCLAWMRASGFVPR
ncbi:MAG TPA: alpha/beta hydrolase [Rhodocyclaceae bacterium]|nr:alpha/beta hydrolase [Rhodocyclaceae bacterium]